MIRVFLVDDHAVVRQGLRLLIDAMADMKVVGESADGRNAAAGIAAAGGADVVVLDVSLAGGTGSAVAAALREELPTTKIVALSRHSEKAYVHQMLQNGATGYVLKQTAAEILIAAIRTVARGGTFLDPAVAGKLVEMSVRAPRGGGEELTAREREVLSMVAYGHTNKEIATTLGITVKTVETHKANGMQKLGIRSRADLVRYALAQEWMGGKGEGEE